MLVQKPEDIRMLVQFAVENFMSFHRRIVFSLRALDSTPASPAYIESSGIRLLKCAAIYGANASGKSNLVSALNFGERLVLSGTAKNKKIPTQSGLGQAIKYVSNRWVGLTRFVNDARVPLDNGATERALRGLAVGRKNHYGSRSRRGTEVAALFYSLLETAKLSGVDPKCYLREAALAALREQPIPLPHQLARSDAS